ncbi:MAG: hypothetical protein L6437_11125 [Kiritimatiellae bacterium]|nr:hypothetical protein [Kiritimatiellia bacterium]
MHDLASAGGVIFYGAGGVMDSCTITKNTGGGNADGTGGVRAKNASSGGTIRNSIVHENISSSPKKDFQWTASTAGILNNCITKDYTTGGSGNITNDPSFVGLDSGDYHLNPDSPCRDKGSVQGWMSGTTDLGGVVARIMPIGGTNDMGCFEFDTDALICSISATPLYGFPPLSVTFTSSVSGDTNGLYYLWDINTNGTFEVEGPDKAGFTTNLTIGLYSIALTVTNAVADVDSCTNANYVRVGPPTNYVYAAGANPVSPYTTWATAATNIQAAINVGAPGTLTLVTNGTYNIENVCITNDMGVTLRSVNGYAHTTVQGSQLAYSGSGIFWIDHASAVVDGFTIKGSARWSPGVAIYAGIVQNCWITGNTNYRPAGVSLSGGTVRNCLISGNTAEDGAAGVQYNSANGLVESCTISSNRVTGTGGQGACGVYNSYDGGIIRNTIVHDNWTAGGNYPAQVYFQDKTDIINCCITTNYITGASGAYVTNGALGAVNTTNDPQFVDGPGGNYRLGQGSPCIATGTNQGWMTDATDLDGNPRILHIVDMGVFEWIPPRGTIIRIW